MAKRGVGPRLDAIVDVRRGPLHQPIHRLIPTTTGGTPGGTPGGTRHCKRLATARLPECEHRRSVAVERCVEEVGEAGAVEECALVHPRPMHRIETQLASPTILEMYSELRRLSVRVAVDALLASGGIGAAADAHGDLDVASTPIPTPRRRRRHRARR